MTIEKFRQQAISGMAEGGIARLGYQGGYTAGGHHAGVGDTGGTSDGTGGNGHPNRGWQNYAIGPTTTVGPGISPSPQSNFPVSSTITNMGAPPGINTSPTHRPKKKSKRDRTKRILKTLLPFINPAAFALSQFPTKVQIGIGTIQGIQQLHDIYSAPDEEEDAPPLYARGGLAGMLGE